MNTRFFLINIFIRSRRYVGNFDGSLIISSIAGGGTTQSNKYLHVVSYSDSAKALSIPLNVGTIPTGTKSIRMKTKSSKKQTLSNGLSIRMDANGMMQDGKVGFDLKFDTEWSIQTINISSLNSSKYHSFALVIPSGNNGVDFFFDDIEFVDANEKTIAVENDYNSYKVGYELVNNKDCYNWRYIAEILADSTNPPVKKGDINKDNVVNSLDLSALLKIIIDNKSVDISTQDMNNDGVVNINDVKIMLNVILK